MDGYQRPVSVPALNEQTSAVVVGDFEAGVLVAWDGLLRVRSDRPLRTASNPASELGSGLRGGHPLVAGEAGVVVVEKRVGNGRSETSRTKDINVNNLHNRRRCPPSQLIAAPCWRSPFVANCCHFAAGSR